MNCLLFPMQSGGRLFQFKIIWRSVAYRNIYIWYIFINQDNKTTPHKVSTPNWHGDGPVFVQISDSTTITTKCIHVFALMSMWKFVCGKFRSVERIQCIFGWNWISCMAWGQRLHPMNRSQFNFGGSMNFKQSKIVHMAILLYGHFCCCAA